LNRNGIAVDDRGIVDPYTKSMKLKVLPGYPRIYLRIGIPPITMLTLAKDLRYRGYQRSYLLREFSKQEIEVL